MPNNDAQTDHKKEKTNTSTDFKPDCTNGLEYIQVISELRGLQESNRAPERKVNKLLKTASWLIVCNVGRWIRQNPEKIEEVLMLAQERSGLDA